MLPLASTVNRVVDGMVSAVMTQVCTPAALYVRVGTAAMQVASSNDLTRDDGAVPEGLPEAWKVMRGTTWRLSSV